MIFWIFMLVMVMLIPIMMIIFGRLFMNRAPKNINHIFGYRTKRSMMSMETWEFAHKYFGKLWFICGLVLLPLSIAAMAIVIGKGTNTVGIVGGIIVFVQMIPLIAAIVPTEKALKENFDEYGRQTAEETSKTIEEIPEIVKKTPGSEKWEIRVDYGDDSNWLMLPESPNKTVDLIYFYPTSFFPESGSTEVIADIDDAGMRTMAAQAFDKQATAFEASCNLYAPFYRQLDATYSLTLAEHEHEELFGYAVSQDASAALDYYFAHYNNGKPFILAGHSQGSETVLYLLTEYFKDHPERYSQMVAAYVIGYSVTDSVLKANPHLKFAESEVDTGVIISWNAEGPENIGQHNSVVLEGAKSINPINWKTDATYASAEENKGSRINGEILYNIADAQIDLERGTVITNADKEYAIPIMMAKLFGPASFHLNDYDLFYKNLEENAQKRISSFLSQ